MKAKIGISTARGVIKAPPSKSYAHRLIICALLSEGRSIIDNVDFSEDIKATIDCATALNAKVTIEGSRVIIDGRPSESTGEVSFMCRESGSTMRFFMGIAMGLGANSRFYGSETLRNRPFGVYEDICKSQNISFEKKDDYICVAGKLKSGTYEVAGNISSQFISGLLFALPLLEGDSKIVLTGGVESRSYIDMTLQALREFGITADWAKENEIKILGSQKYRARECEVEGDYSNAAFLDAFNAMGGEVEVTGLNVSSLQGDRVYKEHFEMLKKGKAEIDISDCPDLGPILFTVAAYNNGGVFTGTKRLAIKESNRGLVMCEELRKFGVETVMEENRIEIMKSKLCKPTEEISGHNDHRIVMSMALLLSRFEGEIEGAQAVTKSYPGFFEDIEKLGIEVHKS
ncbi:MAG: 3-phosphoshikimate 1-carboxyvinyltransferase [Lachnospiraceae bacterium]|nr:3-phosphoshikimate 1-carboxyvinyltransferase [Lachnospiraceae bacterium]